MGKFRYATGLWALGGASDRYVPGGYAEKAATLRDLVNAAGSVDGIEGVEIVHSQLEGIDRSDFSGWLDEAGLKLTGILADTFGDKKYKLGSISHTDPQIRQDAVDLCKRNVDMAAELECPAVVLWLGSDGYDYSFQIDYRDHWNTLRDSITEIARHNRGMKLCLEYKLKEPRKYMTIGAVGKALYLAQACGENVGCVIDFGHALMSKEKPAESAVLLQMNGKLFNVHMNDAYGEWDDDLIAVSVHLQESLEFLFYLEEMKYDGWIGLDIFPFRMDGGRAAELCVLNLRSLEKVLDRVDRGALRQAMRSLDAGESQMLIRNALFND